MKVLIRPVGNARVYCSQIGHTIPPEGFYLTMDREIRNYLIKGLIEEVAVNKKVKKTDKKKAK